MRGLFFASFGVWNFPPPKCLLFVSGPRRMICIRPCPSFFVLLVFYYWCELSCRPLVNHISFFSVDICLDFEVDPSTKAFRPFGPFGPFGLLIPIARWLVRDLGIENQNKKRGSPFILPRC